MTIPFHDGVCQLAATPRKVPTNRHRRNPEKPADLRGGSAFDLVEHDHGSPTGR